MTEREILQLTGKDETSRWLAAMADARQRTLAVVSGLSDVDLERGEPNNMGTLLYHIAAIEADWLYDDIRGQPTDMPMHLFPFDVREEGGRLTPVGTMSLAEHLARLASVRQELVEYVGALDDDSLHRPRQRAHYDVSPAYVLHHLLQHEAEHRAEIGRVLRG